MTTSRPETRPNPAVSPVWKETLVSASPEKKWLRSAVVWTLISIGLAIFLFSSWTRHHPANLVQSTAFFLDSSGQLDFEQVRQKSFTPYTGNLSEGFKRGAIWIRLTLDPALAPAQFSAQRDPVVVRVRPPYLDHVELYDPAEPDKGWRVTGDRHPWSEGEFQSLNHGFVVPLGDRPRELWLRVLNDSTLIVGVDALPLPLMNAQEKLQSYFNSLDLVFLFFLLVWALVLYWMTPDKVVMGYIAIQLTTLFYAAAYFGIFRMHLGEWLSADTVDKLFATLIVLMPMTYLLFFRRLFKGYGLPRWMLASVQPVLFYPLIGVGLVWAGHKWMGVQLAIVLYLLAFAWLSLLAARLLFWPPQKPDPAVVISGRWAAGAFLVFLLAIVVVALPTKGFFQASDISLYRNGFHTLLSSTLLGALLFIRARRYEARRLAAIVASSEEAKYERRRREEQSQFFAMLTHEIRTPLAVMAYASKTPMSSEDLSRHVDRCVLEIDEIIERCEQADLLEQGGPVIEPQTVKLADLIDSVLTRFPGRERVKLFGATDLTVETDRTLLTVVLSNLLDNALKYSERNSPVDLNLALENRGDRHGVSITLTNQLGEFDPPDPTQLYNKYYRSALAHAKTGSGLGLYLVKAFTEKLGGVIEYTPQPPLVTFRLWVPV